MSGETRKVGGSFLGTGAELSVRTVGFRPSRVELHNVGGNCNGYWQNTMADASAYKQVQGASGVFDISFATSLGVTPLADGFTLGADTDLNVSTQKVHWTAYD